MPIRGNPLSHPFAIPDLLRPGVERSPDEVALISHSTRWTWRELDEASDRLAANLLGHGLEPGDRVASLMPNRGVLLLHYIACMKARLVVVPLNYRYMPPEIDHALEVSGASILVAHAERGADVAASKHGGRLRLGVVWYDSKDPGGPTLEELIDAQPQSAALPPPEPSAPAFIFFTSGSTGPAKGVTHTFESLGWMFASTAAAFELTPADVMLPGSSISHLGGFIFSFGGLGSGARVIVAHSTDAHEMLRLLRENKPTVLCMLPAALFNVVRDHCATNADFASLRLCRSGSDKVPAELEKEFTELTGHPIDEGYGCSEIGLITLNPPSGVIKLGSVGCAVPGFTLSVRDGDGRELPPGKDGALWVQARSVMAGYWNDADATAATMRDGWLDTGDLMKADDDGYLWFRGRKKQIIVHDGSNICPQEVEGALLEHPAVEITGVIGVHDVLHGEDVRAYVVLKQGAARPPVQELIDFARQRIGYKAPEQIEFLDQMPLNPTGKVDRVALKRMAAERHAPGLPG